MIRKYANSNEWLCVGQGEEIASSCADKPPASKEHSRAKIQEQELCIKDLKQQLKFVHSIISSVSSFLIKETNSVNVLNLNGLEWESDLEIWSIFCIWEVYSVSDLLLLLTSCNLRSLL